VQRAAKKHREPPKKSAPSLVTPNFANVLGNPPPPALVLAVSLHIVVFEADPPPTVSVGRLDRIRKVSTATSAEDFVELTKLAVGNRFVV